MQIRSRKRSAEICQKIASTSQLKTTERSLHATKNTKIDLGAYGKGIGTDEAIKMIKKDKEITGAMVALGGSIVVYGEKSDGSDWNVGIQDPNGKDGEVLGGIKVKSGTSISTSGDYEKTFTDKKTGKRYFHILDSKTGYSVKTDIRSCTIICNQDSTQTDYLQHVSV